MRARPITPVGTYLIAWAALLALVPAMIGLVHLPLGSFTAFAVYAVAAAEAVLVMRYFMHLKRSSALTVVFATVGFFWLAFLFALSLSDFMTCTRIAPPW
jgi:cytochrome c oxidase subunit 4